MWISSTNSTLEVESAGELGRGGSSGEEMGEWEGGEKERKEGGGESGNIRWVNVEWGESGCATGGVGERGGDGGWITGGWGGGGGGRGAVSVALLSLLLLLLSRDVRPSRYCA